MSNTDHTPVEDLPYANKLVTRLPHAESELRQKIAEAVGAASSCWDNLSGAGVFDSERASQVADELVDEVLRLTSMGEPSLGCATTAQLADELATRIRLGFAGDPDYRSVQA